jgi:hypothetical protein
MLYEMLVARDEALHGIEPEVGKDLCTGLVVEGEIVGSDLFYNVIGNRNYIFPAILIVYNAFELPASVFQKKAYDFPL